VIYYVDTSALAKIYHPEDGFEFVRKLYRGNDVIRISELTRVEFASVMRRKYLAGELSSGAQRVSWGRFWGDTKSRYEVLSLTSGVLEEAARLLRSDGLAAPFRSLDAIQFATLTLLCPVDAVFVCSDKRLAAVAERHGRAVLDPAFP